MSEPKPYNFLSPRWTPEEDVELGTLVAEGLSGAQASARMGRSRGSVIGRASRLGLHFRSIEPKGGERKQHAPARPEATAAVIKPRLVGLLDIPLRGACRWPMWNDDGPAPGGDDAVFCGAATAEGCVYCEGHRRIAGAAYDPGKATGVFSVGRKSELSGVRFF